MASLPAELVRVCVIVWTTVDGGRTVVSYTGTVRTTVVGAPPLPQLLQSVFVVVIITSTGAEKVSGTRAVISVVAVERPVGQIVTYFFVITVVTARSPEVTAGTETAGTSVVTGSGVPGTAGGVDATPLTVVVW